MKKLMRLVGVQLWAVLGDTLSIGNNRKKRHKILYIGVVAFILGMSCISFFYSFMIGSGLKKFHSLEIFPALIMAVTCMVVLMTTIFKVKGTIFGFRDYDTVMSLPISTGGVVASRLIILYALNMVFVLIIILPMMIAYGILATPDLIFYLIGFIEMIVLPFVPIVIASFIGTILAYVASRFKHTNILNILFPLALIIAMFGLSFTMEDNGQEMVNMSLSLTQQVNSIYPLAGLYTKGVVEYNFTAFLMFVGISVFAFLVFTLIVKKVFKKVNTLIMTGGTRTKFKMGELKLASPLKALYLKEIKRYFSSPIYVLNTSIGIVMLTMGAIALIFVDLEKVLGAASLGTETIARSGPIFIAFCAIMSCTTSSTISLEGKNLWIMKSLPIEPRSIYLAKIGVNLTIIAPALIDAVIIGIVLKMGVLITVCLVLVTLVCAIFISIYGLVINLLLPNFDWTSEVVVVKQSAAAMIAIFSGMAMVGIQFFLLLFMPSATLAYISYILFMSVVDAILYKILMSYGKKRFATL